MGKAFTAIALSLKDHWGGLLEGPVITRHGYETLRTQRSSRPLTSLSMMRSCRLHNAFFKWFELRPLSVMFAKYNQVEAKGHSSKGVLASH
ncbi:hypothetical protein C9I56_24095 [Paraburkholderia caribensis]|nr:hypothetical protein C9I56_24095 [Paraburkholderia caribensis]